jgi:LysR family cys regulon transcriptional activator
MGHLGKADIGIATEGLSQFKELVSFPVTLEPRDRGAQGPPAAGAGTGHAGRPGTWPLITYDVGFTGRGHIDEAFRQAGIEPDIVLTAMDSDVIQQYVSLGMGVGLVASMAVDQGKHTEMVAINASHLFRPTSPGWRCGAVPTCAATPSISSSSSPTSSAPTSSMRSMRPTPKFEPGGV